MKAAYLSAMLLCSFAAFLSRDAHPQTPYGGRPLSAQQKAALEERALAGSGAAALEIALFHGTRDTRLLEYWSWIGAENGDPTCQFNYASILMGKGDRYSRLRAIYWMKKAAANKVDLAERRLEEMK